VPGRNAQRRDIAAPPASDPVEVSARVEDAAQGGERINRRIACGSHRVAAPLSTRSAAIELRAIRPMSLNEPLA
jgi:hypothetical protein